VLHHWNMDRPRQPLPGADLSLADVIRSLPRVRAPERSAFTKYPAGEPLPGCPCGIMNLKPGVWTPPRYLVPVTETWPDQRGSHSVSLGFRRANTSLTGHGRTAR
jgi:hypothetical protein